MRSISVLLPLAAAAGCSAAYQQPSAGPQGTKQLQQLTAGKVPQPPLDCVPSYNANDMTVIDGSTLAFRRGAATTYMVHLSQGCSLLGRPGYAMLTKQFGGTGLCRGEIAQVVDTSNGITVGSCTVGEVIPYTAPR